MEKVKYCIDFYSSNNFFVHNLHTFEVFFAITLTISPFKKVTLITLRSSTLVKLTTITIRFWRGKYPTRFIMSWTESWTERRTIYFKYTSALSKATSSIVIVLVIVIIWIEEIIRFKQLPFRVMLLADATLCPNVSLFLFSSDIRS